MAELPDPTPRLSPDDAAALATMASVRAHAEGRAALGQVYVRMFNNPSVARAVGALGEQLRFGGLLPDRQRELVILRYAARRRLGYEWSHHVRPARQAGLDDATVAALLGESLPAGLSEVEAALVGAVDAVVSGEEIPPAVQARVVAAHGEAGIVEVVALCGLYGLIGAVLTSFAIGVEDGMPTPPF
jgi:4-carboxymuconolactone decarboxylase